MHRLKYFTLFAILMLSACQNNSKNFEEHGEIMRSMSVIPEVITIKETFTTLRDVTDNVDSPAIWHSGDGQNWLLATAKEGNVIIAYDAATGDKIARFGSPGNNLGELSRPNGIAVIDNYAVIVERDNHRIQVFSLPGFESLGVFGETVLRLPYGITIDKFEDTYHLYVTDNFETPDEETPPGDNLRQRVHHFMVTIENNQIAPEHIKAFGETSGEGVLYKVESILIDRAHNRLLIADEYEEHRNVKIYDVEGKFTGQIIPHNYFFYEPEGIVIWACEADSSGYYLMVDQGKINNTFQVFDRKTLEYIGGFGGEITRNTDGIAITQEAFGDFKYGAFYPVHNDGSITAIAWEDIAKNLNLRYICN